MKRTVFLLFLGVMQALSAQAQSNLQKLATAELTFVFVSKGVEGHISGFRSTSTFDTNTPEKSVFKGSADVSTLKTGNFLRDWSLRGGKYFNADDYPEITFESTKVTSKSNGFSVEGGLTIKNTTKTVTIDFHREGNTLVGTTTLFSSDFGIEIKKERKDNHVNIKMVFSLKDEK